jgi:hypothetical protein
VIDIKESIPYDNYMDKSVRIDDGYKATLEKYMGEEIANQLPDKIKSKAEKAGVYKIVFVKFRNVDDMERYCSLIGQCIDYKTKIAYYPKADPEASLFGEEEEPTNIKIDKSLLIPHTQSKSDSKLDVEVKEAVVDVNSNWRTHWIDMPEYLQENDNTFRAVDMYFRTKKHYDDFAKRINLDLSDLTNSTWYPKRDIVKNRTLRWVDSGKAHSLNHPMYIVSKGRSNSMHTSKSLSRMKIPHYIVIEPQDEQNYEKALDEFNIREYVTLLIAPFSNHGDGPGRARNWAWEHSISIGAKWHWVLDDNINDFYRLNRNERIRFESSTGFRVMEDFCDRYENVYIAGPQYRFFCPSDQAKPGFVTNTRIYSCLLIRNDCKHKWRGRYNEDTDICLRVMKDGDVCLQFHAFLQEKMATQTVKGGNTEEFYHAENTDGIKSGYNSDGTINKSQMLVDMHPDVARVVWRYGRWHHHVDYNPFKKNKLKLKDNLTLSKSVNEYGMILDRDFKDPRFPK